MNNIKAGFALCGSYCTFAKAIEQIQFLVDNGIEITPIMSENAYSTDTRFGKAKDHIERIEAICQKEIIHSIRAAEPIGPKNELDIMIIEPCTGNTIAKLANGITDTCVTLAAKAHMRNSKPLLIAVSTNDALSSSAANIGRLMNTRNVYFVPLRQDNPSEKPRSVVADFDKTLESIHKAIKNEQIQPILTAKI